MNVSISVRELADSKPAMDPNYHPPWDYRTMFTWMMSYEGEQAAFELSGEKVRSYLIDLLTSDVEALNEGESQPTLMHTSMGDVSGVPHLPRPETPLSSPYRRKSWVSSFLG